MVVVLDDLLVLFQSQTLVDEGTPCMEESAWSGRGGGGGGGEPLLRHYRHAPLQGGPQQH